MAYNILILDPATYRVWLSGQNYNTTTRLSVRDWCIHEDAELCFNLGMFDMGSGRGITYVHTPHGDLGYGGASDKLELPGGYACQGYSNGIKAGKISINKPLGGSRTRNGIGITDRGHIIIAQSGHKVTEATFCGAVNQYVLARSQTVKLFVLQDGGGSTAEWSNVSRLGFTPEGGRPVSTVVCVKRKVQPVLSRPLYNGCKGDDVSALQLILGGIAADGDAGPATASRIKVCQKALGFPSALQCGIVSAYTAKKLGYKSNI